MVNKTLSIHLSQTLNLIQNTLRVHSFVYWENDNNIHNDHDLRLKKYRIGNRTIIEVEVDFAVFKTAHFP